MLTPTAFIDAYDGIGQKKAGFSSAKILLLGILAGFLIGMGGVVTNTAGFALTNTSAAKVVSGLLFPFGLAMVILTGAELFTGNCLLIMPKTAGKISGSGMAKVLIVSYTGNLIGSLLLAAACVYSGQVGLGGGALAVYTIKVAAGKCALSAGKAVLLGILCNILVCIAVAISLSADNTVGRFVGAYIPIAFFVIAGFEHCVANMYYIPAGLMAAGVPAYAEAAAAAGIDMSALTVGACIMHNLLPVTIGNIIGGMGFALLFAGCHRKKQA
ncbi:MAG: formate/nitrite transporter family protein [Eubacterium sp.]|nr:formate/nitrite transporter family protein [Eubacterium sp.]